MSILSPSGGSDAKKVGVSRECSPGISQFSLIELWFGFLRLRARESRMKRFLLFLPFEFSFAGLRVSPSFFASHCYSYHQMVSVIPFKWSCVIPIKRSLWFLWAILEWSFSPRELHKSADRRFLEPSFSCILIIESSFPTISMCLRARAWIPSPMTMQCSETVFEIDLSSCLSF